MPAYDFQAITSSVGHLASLALSSIGWFIYFISTVIAQADVNRAVGVSAGSAVFAMNWYYIFLFAATIIGIAFLILTGEAKKYRVLIAGILVMDLVFLTGELSGTVRSTDSRYLAMAAGSFFLVFGFFPWLIIFGSDDDTVVSKLAHSSVKVAAVPKVAMPAMPSVTMPSVTTPGFFKKFGPGQAASPQDAPQGVYAIPLGSTDAMAAQQQPPMQYQGPPPAGMVAPGPATIPMGPPSAGVDYTKRALALYPYDANPADPNEISFMKGEVLEIGDSSGKWWQARRTLPDGSVQVGIAPSNYLQLQ